MSNANGTILVEALRSSDRARWEKLARGYQDFYRRNPPPEFYEAVWTQIEQATQVFAIGARVDGMLAGIGHFLFHPRIGFGEACYLQDLFVDESRRGAGIGRALIEGVCTIARTRGCSRVYWHTRENNAPARLLYDSLATFDGFIRYDRSL